MKKYNRIMLGKGSMYAEECKKEGYIGANFLPNNDLTGYLYDEWKDFNKEFIPVYLKEFPDKTKVTAGLACGNLWTICRGLLISDIVLSPNGLGQYYVGEIVGNYYYMKDTLLPHRRKVKWLDVVIQRSDMSDELKLSTGSIGTCCDITQYKEEIDNLIGKNAPAQIYVSDKDIEDPSEFALEKHLEDFLVKNWDKTEIGKKYKIYEDDEGQAIGEQFQTDTGAIDILAKSKNNKILLVIELKRGKVSDVVVGQIQRYMGFVKEMAEPGQEVKGIIIGLEADLHLKRALSVCTNIEFYKYQIDFKLFKML